jgi:signal transduction histidine kinase
MPRRSLRSRIALWFGAALLGVVGCILIVLQLRVRAETHVKVLGEMRDAEAVLVYLLQARAETLKARARAMGDLPKIGTLVDTEDSLTVQDVAPEIPALAESDFVMLTNARGIVLAHTAEPARIGRDASREAGVAAALAGETTAEIHREQNRLFQIASAPARAGGTLTGTIQLGFAMDDDFVAGLRAASGIHLTVVAGPDLPASTLDRSLRQAARDALLALPGASPSDLNAALLVAGADGPSAGSALPPARPGGRIGVATTPSPRSLPPFAGKPFPLAMAGREFLTIVYPMIDGSGRRVGSYLIQKSMDDALSPHLSIQRWLLAIGLVGLMLGMLANWLMARSITEPILRLARAAEALGSGDWSPRVPTHSRDEIGVLARTFNAMAARLQSWDSDLRAAVAERTAELNQAVIQLDAAMTQMRRFTADVSHELRTPLTILRGETEVALRSPRSPEEYQRTLRSILEEAQHLSRVIEQLLTLARADSGELRLETHPVALHELLADLHDQALILARPQGIAVTLSCPPFLQARGDELRLRQLFLNLLDNAVKYTGPGGGIRIEAGSEGTADGNAECVVTVCDTGVGIAPEDLPHLFERFFRADRSRGREAGGAGLGLAICHWIVTAHGGAIEVTSAPGAGSAFRVRLPAARPEEAPEEARSGV